MSSVIRAHVNAEVDYQISFGEESDVRGCHNAVRASKSYLRLVADASISALHLSTSSGRKRTIKGSQKILPHRSSQHSNGRLSLHA